MKVSELVEKLRRESQDAELEFVIGKSKLTFGRITPGKKVQIVFDAPPSPRITQGVYSKD